MTGVNCIIKQIMNKKTVLILTSLIITIFLNHCEEKAVCYRRLDFLDYTVSYEVTGTDSTALITYIDEYGDQNDLKNASIPWSYSFTTRGDTYVVCIAKSPGDTGIIRATLFVNGDTLVSDTSEEGVKIVSFAVIIPGSGFYQTVTEYH